MIINNAKDFVKFLGDEEISIRHQLDSCIKMAAKICGCQKSRKAAKVNECNTMYIDFIKANADALVDVFRQRTADTDIRFYHDTHHIIKVLKLR